MKTTMTDKLKEVFDRLNGLKDQPAEKQDRVAARLLDHLDAEEAREETPLAGMVGTASGLFRSPEEVDQFIRRERDAWE